MNSVEETPISLGLSPSLPVLHSSGRVTIAGSSFQQFKGDDVIGKAFIVTRLLAPEISPADLLYQLISTYTCN